MPLTTEQRRRNEASIRAAMDRLLLGQLPARGGCDLKTLAREAGVARTGFYARTDPQGNQRPGPYQHLAEEFQRRLADLREAGTVSDPRELQITRLKAENAKLRERVRERDARITELTEFKGARVVTTRRAARRDPPASTTRRLAEQRPHPPHRQEVEDHRTMRLNEALFQRSTATRHHPSTDRKVDRLMWTHTAPMGFTGWSQRDTLTTGHGHCCDNRRQHTGEVEQIMRALATRGLSLHGFGVKITGLARYADALASSDSASWSLRGRHVPGCSPSHRSESNCLRFALAWHAQVVRALEPPSADAQAA